MSFCPRTVRRSRRRRRRRSRDREQRRAEQRRDKNHVVRPLIPLFFPPPLERRDTSPWPRARSARWPDRSRCRGCCDEDRRPGRLEREQRAELRSGLPAPPATAEVIPDEAPIIASTLATFNAEKSRAASSGSARAGRCQLAGGVGAHQLDRGRVDRRQPTSVFTNTGKKQSTAAIIFESGFEQAEPVVRDRCEGDDRDGVRRDRVRHHRAPRARGSARDERPAMPADPPITKPPRASLNVYRPPPRARRARPRTRRISSAAAEELLDVRAATRPSQSRARGRARRRPAATSALRIVRPAAARRRRLSP